MKIYLNEKEVSEEVNRDNISEILDYIYKNSNNEIINEIKIDGISVNQDYLHDNFEKLNDVSILKFKTQKVNQLIIESLEQANEYLPILKDGILETVNLLRNNELLKADKKYQQILDGLEWYIDIISKIISLVEEEHNRGSELVNSLNDKLSEIIIAYEKDDMLLIADLLEYEILDIIETFINYNTKIYKKFNQEDI